LVLVFLLFFCPRNRPIAGVIVNQIATKKCDQTIAAVM
jgi:hypothetical protein